MAELKRPFPVAPHLVDPTGCVLVWLTEPAGMVHQLAPGTLFTNERARWIVGPATDAMLARKAARYHFVHDWRGVSSYESAARFTLIGWGQRLATRIARIDIAIAPDAPQLLRMAVAGGTMAMALVGVTCELVADPATAIAASGLRAA